MVFIIFIIIGFKKRSLRFWVIAINLMIVFSTSCASNSENKIFKTIENLKNNTTYYWKIKAKNSNASVSESVIRKFHVKY